MERFGADPSGVRYYTLFNDSAQSQTGLMVEEPGSGAGTNTVATEMLSGAVLPQTGGGWRVTLDPQSTAVIRIEPGPRFRSAQLVPGDFLRLTIDSPLQLPQVLESASNQRNWEPRLTNTPLESPYIIDLPMAAARDAEFFRLRF
jgi:hypothetical protein